MFKRLLLDDATAIVTAVAFVTAATIFIAMAWRAIRMPRAQSDNLANLPFNSDSSDRHDSHA
jgi:hypothetical protein